MQKFSELSTRRVLFIGLGLLLLAVAYAAGTVARIESGSKPGAELHVAEKAVADGNGKLAEQLLTPLAAKGSGEANYWLADIYEHGVGMRPDQAKAINHLTKAAKEGYLQAQVRLGEVYLRGEETLQDFGQARTWLSKAALRGSGKAARDLGRIYDEGLGVARDPITAYAWYENAVRQGDPQASRLRDRVVPTLTPTELSQAEGKAGTLNTEIAKAT